MLALFKNFLTFLSEKLQVLWKSNEKICQNSRKNSKLKEKTQNSRQKLNFSAFSESCAVKKASKKSLECNDSHLSKHPSDLKQNGTQEKTPFSSTVFHALSHGVIRFVASVSSKNHLMTGWNSLTANQGAYIQWFLKLTLATKRSTPCERVWKTVPENGVFSCVPFCLRSLGCFAKCEV